MVSSRRARKRLRARIRLGWGEPGAGYLARVASGASSPSSAAGSSRWRPASCRAVETSGRLPAHSGEIPSASSSANALRDDASKRPATEVPTESRPTGASRSRHDDEPVPRAQVFASMRFNEHGIRSAEVEALAENRSRRRASTCTSSRRCPARASTRPCSGRCLCGAFRRWRRRHGEHGHFLKRLPRSAV